MSETIAPAPAQDAPVIDTTPFVPDTASHAVPGRDFNATIRAVANKTAIPAEPVTPPTPTVQFKRDPVNADGEKIVPAVETAAEAPAPTESTSELSIDNGEVVLSSQRNGDGTFKTKLDPNEKVDLVIKSIIDKETGKPKVYSKSLPELARLAKDGITLQPINQQLTTELQAIQPEVEYYRTNVPKWQQETTTLQEQLDAQKALNRELLEAEDDIVIQRREQYRAEMTPEKQLQRERAERAAEKAAHEAERTKTQAQKRREQHEVVAKSFVGSRIAPALAAAEATGLSKYTVTGLVTEITSDLVVNGVIPPAAWPEMERRINDPNGPFQKEVKAEAAKRTQESDSVKAAREAAEAAQKKAQTVVNTDGRLMAPIGRAGPDSASPQPPAKNSKEVLDRIIHRPLPESVARSA